MKVYENIYIVNNNTLNWMMVDVAFVARFPRFVTLAHLKSERALAGMMVTKPGMRLSVQPVSREHFEIVKKMGTAKG